MTVCFILFLTRVDLKSLSMTVVQADHRQYEVVVPEQGTPGRAEVQLLSQSNQGTPGRAEDQLLSQSNQGTPGRAEDQLLSQSNRGTPGGTEDPAFSV